MPARPYLRTVLPLSCYTSRVPSHNPTCCCTACKEARRAERLRGSKVPRLELTPDGAFLVAVKPDR